MIITCDIDDVVCNFQDGFDLFHNAKYGTNLTRKDHFSFLLSKVLNVSHEESIERVNEYFHSEAFDHVQPIAGAYEILKDVDARLIAVTSRPHWLAERTQEWLSIHYPGIFKELYFTSHFWENPKKKSDICRDVGAVLHIEDCLDYAIDCAQVSRVLLYDTPWNQGECANVLRVASWDEIGNVLPREW